MADHGPNRELQTIYAWLADEGHPDGQGVMAIRTDDGSWLPLVGGTLSSVELMEPAAKKAAETLHVNVNLVKFVRSEIVKTHNWSH